LRCTATFTSWISVRGTLTEAAYAEVKERGAVGSTVLARVVALTAAAGPNCLSRLVSRHARLGPCNIDGELDRLRFGSKAHVSLHGYAASLLRGGNPVITVSKQKALVLPFKERHWR